MNFAFKASLELGTGNGLSTENCLPIDKKLKLKPKPAAATVGSCCPTGIHLRNECVCVCMCVRE